MEPEGLTYYSRLLQVQVARWGGWGPHSFHSCHFYPNRNNLRYPYICIHILHMCTCSAFPSFSFSTDSTVFRWMINSQWEKQLLFRISPPPPSPLTFAICALLGFPGVFAKSWSILRSRSTVYMIADFPHLECSEWRTWWQLFRIGIGSHVRQSRVC